MGQYINKSAVVAEIERRKTNIKEYCLQEGHDARFDVVPEQLSYILSFIDTLEVKEVQEEPVSNDLEDYAKHYLLHEHISPLNEILHQADLKVEMQYHKDIENAFKAGFKLGLKAQKGE